jgi:prophage antirepressor-like protein
MKLTNELNLNFSTHNVRVLVDENNEPWFVANEVAKILGYKHPAKAVRTHCKGGGESPLPSAGGVQMTKIIKEHDVYRLVFKSKLPSAEQFEKWVVEDVLPSIRKTGAYVTPATAMELLQDPKNLIQLLTNFAQEQEKRKELEQKLEVVSHELVVKDRQLIEVHPKVVFHDEVLSAAGTFTSTNIAKSLNMSAIELNKLLYKLNVIYKRSKTWYPYQKYQDKGLVKMTTYLVEKTPGAPKEVVTHLRWTPEGYKFIHELVNPILKLGQVAANKYDEPVNLKLPS